MTRRRHSMAFGAEPLTDGGIRFRLWAPRAQSVALALPGRGENCILPMTAQADGWYELATDLAAPGDAYAYVIDGGRQVPDPAARCQAGDVHGPSRVVDPTCFDWQDGAWHGRPWEEAVCYELHVGSFTPQGSFEAARGRLEYLAGLGVTAIQLMPVAQFPGQCNWGYDGVLPFAVENRYGSPDDLKNLVQTAHGLGLMVLLDVVYNHFGPEGNYLHLYAPDFFTASHKTPWGDAIDFGNPWVRRFFIHNALYWLEEFHFDGLRLDAVHAISEALRPVFLEELADAVRATCAGRQVHLLLENDDNAVRHLVRDSGGRPRYCAAQWNDDFHHALHVLLTGETCGYYRDYGADPAAHLGRCLAEGFAYQGESSAYRNGRARGEPSAGLPPAAFVNFLQNHDQIGNRALGERLARLTEPAAIRAASVLLLLAPSPPMLFMGQEWGSTKPFVYFCDFEPELAARVSAGRRAEFSGFPEFADPATRELIPDPGAVESFEACRLDWENAASTEGAEWLDWHRRLLDLRHQEIVPRLAGIQGGCGRFDRFGRFGLRVNWLLGGGSRLTLLANLGDEPAEGPPFPRGRLIFEVRADGNLASVPLLLPAWFAAWFIEEAPQP